MPDALKDGWVRITSTHSDETAVVTARSWERVWSEKKVDGKQAWKLADSKAEPAPTPASVPPAPEATNGGKA